MEKFELSTRRSLAIVSYIAASMGYSKEEIKFITAGMLKQKDEVNEFHKILTEPLDKIVRVEHKGEVKDLVEPFNLVERIQMVIELILNKSTVTEPVNLKPTASVYQYSPFKFSNFTKKPVDESKLAHEEYLCDEALIKKFGEKRLEAIIKERVEEELQKRENLEKERQEEARLKELHEETMARINGSARFSRQENVYSRPFYSRPFPHQQPRPDFTPGFNPSTGEYATSEIEELSQAIETLVRLRDKLILDNNEQNLNGRNKESQETKEQPEPFEPVKFTEEQRQRQREILSNTNGTTSRYDQIANEKVRKLSEYSIRDSSEHLFDKTLRNRTETEAMISRSIEIYPSTNLCKDSLDVNNFKELFSFVRVDGDRLYRINDSAMQPWNRSKPLGSIRLIEDDLGFFNAVKFIVKVNEDAVKEYVNDYFDNPYVILDAVNSKYGFSITPDDIVADSSFETPNQYLFRCSYYRVADELKESLKKDHTKLIKRLVRDSAIVVMADNELRDWLKGKNPTNS